MTGCPARASRYFYYVCSAGRKSGKTVCSAKPLNKTTIEDFVIDRVRENILTDKNLAELIRLTNAEIGSSKKRYADELKTIDKRLGALQTRLGKLYDALETGKLTIDDLAPRIRQLKAEIDSLQATRSDMARKMDDARPALLDEKMIVAYSKDLKQILGKGTIIEQKSFLRSFIRRIEVHKDKIVIDYTIPIDKGGGDPPTCEVLPLVQSGSPNRTRTEAQW
jgi:site-specific DNA recombinase